jgi:hypothetical protein
VCNSTCRTAAWESVQQHPNLPTQPFIDCLADCIRQSDPINNIGSQITGQSVDDFSQYQPQIAGAILLGGTPVPKGPLRDIGVLRGGLGNPADVSGYTSVPSLFGGAVFGPLNALTTALRAGGRGTQMLLLIPYGLVMAGVETACAAHCAGQ